MKTIISSMNADELKARLTQAVEQAYFRRSRNLPANLAAIVDTFKGDILKAFPDIPVETVEDAIVTATLHSEDALSPAFFFQAVKKVWWQPKTNHHQWDGKDEDLAYWRDRVKFLERAGLAGSEQHRHACEMMKHYSHHETEQDTISLLDTCAALLKDLDAAKAQGQAVSKYAELKGVRVELPAFNTRREYGYLILRGQLDAAAATDFIKDAVVEVNADRLDTNRHRLTKEEAEKSQDVAAKAMRLAVLDWLRRCNAQGTTPSAILTPIANESTYQRYRRTSA